MFDLDLLPSANELEAERLKRSLKLFVQRAWSLVEPSTALVWTWYLEDECDHLQALVEGRFDKIIFNVPPGSGKSSVVATLFPCWIWARDPSRRFLFASYKASLALRDSVRRRYVMLSDWYKERFPNVQFTEDQNQKGVFYNTAKGMMMSMGRGGSTGDRAHYLILDDPNDTTEMESEVQRESCLMWIDHQWSTRGDGDYKEVVIQQRSHEQDVTGHYLKQGGYVLFRLPMEYDPDIKSDSPLPIHDPRTKKGELLEERIFSKGKVETLKRKLGSYGTAGQLQQVPTDAAGGIFKKSYFRRYVRKGNLITLPDGRTFDIYDNWVFATVDLAARKEEVVKTDPDYTVISVWCVFQDHPHGPNVFLLEVVRDRMEGPDMEAKVEQVASTWHLPLVLLETIGYQLSAAQSLIRKGIPIREASTKLDAAYRIEKDKTSRAMAATPLMENGRFWIPVYAPWLSDWEAEHLVFPNGAHDDQVDCTSMAVGLAQKYGPPVDLNEQMPKRRKLESTGDDGVNREEPVRQVNSYGMDLSTNPLSHFRLPKP